MILKLKNAGEEMVLAVAAVEIVPSTDPKMGAQVKFTSADGDDLYVGESAVTRQLDRCGVAEISDLPGRNIHFSRAANKNAGFPPYWNLSRATAGDVVKSPPTNGKPVFAASGPGALLPNETGDEDYLPRSETVTIPKKVPSNDLDTLWMDYSECFGQALAFAQSIKAAGIPVDGSAVFASTATLFIERNKRGI